MYRKKAVAVVLGGLLAVVGVAAQSEGTLFNSNTANNFITFGFFIFVLIFSMKSVWGLVKGLRK